MTGDRQHLMPVDELVGSTVVNDKGENLAKIETIIVEPETGRAVYGVLSSGGFLGMGEKFFAVPWSLFRFGPDHHQPVLDVSREKLENAPAFRRDDRPDFSSPEWANDIAAHYGTALFDIVGSGTLAPDPREGGL